MNYKNIKLNKKGYTLLELLVVILIISILFTISLFSYNNYIKRAHIDSVEGDLNAYMTEFNQFIEDYDFPKISTELNQISNKNEYLNFLYCGNKEGTDSKGNNVTITDNAQNFAPGSFLGILQSYISTSFEIKKISEDVSYKGETKHYVILTTTIKKDVFGNPYKFLIDTSGGSIIVASAGQDGKFTIKTYAVSDFGDDVVLAITKKI